MDAIDSIKKILIVVATASVVACGGGDSGPAPAEYTGITSQAVVDNGNSKPFNETSAVGAGSGSGIGGVFGSVQGGSNDRNNLKAFSKSIRKIIKKLDIENSANTPNNLAVAYSDSIEGGCGGGASFSVDFDEITYDFSGSMSFNNFNDCEGTINGSVSFSGTLDLSTVTGMGPFNMTFSTVSYTDSDASMTMTGNISNTPMSDNQDKMVMSMDFRNNNTNVTYRVKDLTMLVSIDGNIETTIVESGKVYHPDYGYVNVITTEDIVTSLADGFPSSGVLQMTGAENSATIIYNNNNSYTINIDLGNNETIDEVRECTWDPDTCGALSSPAPF